MKWGGGDLEQMAYIAMKNKEYSQALGYWNILIDNIQRPNKDYMAEKLKCLYKLSLTEKANEFISTIKNAFSTYRNLDHMINSAQFFGKPEVTILENMEGAYRIIDCNTEDNSNILFITFGKVSSRHDHIPFGYPFLVKQGYRHIHVAQYKGTQYQDLSFEEFEIFFKNIAFKYDKVFTYGSSLGAYAALYYAGAVNAKAIASDPRLPLHPMNEKFKNIIWKENSHYDEYELKHTSMSTNRISDKKPIIIYDRHDVIDSNFCENYILQVYRTEKIINIANTKHASLFKLKSEGKLKQFVIDVVEDKLDVLKYKMNEVIEK